MRRKERVCCEGKASITTKAMAFLLLLLLLFGTVSLPINAETNGAGDHVVICQVYGGSDNGVASHSFIELYNPTTEAIDLTGWSIQYRSSSNGPHGDSWNMFPLQGTIAVGSIF